MLTHPNFDPIAVQLGPISIHWYGLMYLVGFATVWLLGRYRIAKGDATITTKSFEDLIFFCVLGVVIGGRLGYILFYKPGAYLTNPIAIFYVWEGGMSFHGGLLGVIAAMIWFAHRERYSFLNVADFLAPLIPLGLAAGRLGNFINGELWGRPSDLPWAMVFPLAGDDITRHPSQLYEMLLEGVLLFIILWWFSGKQRKTGQVSGLFLIGYGSLRFLVEYTREPDTFLGLFWGLLSMGQLLSLPMIFAGIALFILSRDKSIPAP